MEVRLFDGYTIRVRLGSYILTLTCNGIHVGGDLFWKAMRGAVGVELLQLNVLPSTSTIISLCRHKWCVYIHGQMRTMEKYIVIVINKTTANIYIYMS